MNLISLAPFKIKKIDKIKWHNLIQPCLQSLVSLRGVSLWDCRMKCFVRIFIQMCVWKCHKVKETFLPNKTPYLGAIFCDRTFVHFKILIGFIWKDICLYLRSIIWLQESSDPGSLHPVSLFSSFPSWCSFTSDQGLTSWRISPQNFKSESFQQHTWVKVIKPFLFGRNMHLACSQNSEFFGTMRVENYSGEFVQCITMYWFVKIRTEPAQNISSCWLSRWVFIFPQSARSLINFLLTLFQHTITQFQHLTCDRQDMLY